MTSASIRDTFWLALGVVLIALAFWTSLAR
jgi:hypothetical protein